MYGGAKYPRIFSGGGGGGGGGYNILWGTKYPDKNDDHYHIMHDNVQ